MLLLPSSVAAKDARNTLRMLAQALKREADANIMVDASGLEHFDSSVLSVLLECQRLAQAWGKGFEVRGAPAKLVQLAGLYGVDGVLLSRGGDTPLSEAPAAG